ncbi:hypothetical protein [Amorphus orientalis]|uniref:Cbb3-type cytochrome oxidase subunit 3 n=1 Tax=Amorphus orientalis TaxID=649198 RepID=A0AAE3VKL8_9HYPH|nr:hypothetical protein [Amorphus orientalis]MDQ0313658.1 cbb3-type cytochrome oxidase subunit 3 [Amorphus orientalis]
MGRNDRVVFGLFGIGVPIVALLGLISPSRNTFVIYSHLVLLFLAGIGYILLTENKIKKLYRSQKDIITEIVYASVISIFFGIGGFIIASDSTSRMAYDEAALFGLLLYAISTILLSLIFLIVRWARNRG